MIMFINHPRRFVKATVVVLLSAIIPLVIYDFWLTAHRVSFEIDSKYKVEMKAKECSLCFLDWPIDFVIKITKIKTNKKYRHKFWMSNGPYIEFGTPKNGENKLLIRGYGENYMHNWLIDFDKGTIEEVGELKELLEANVNYIFHQKLNEKFEIIER